MSGINASGYGILPQLIANSVTVHQQLDTLTEQASTGMVSQTYAGLASGETSVSLDLNQQINALGVAQTNIGQATGTMGVTQSAITQLQDIASTFAADIPDLDGLNASNVDSIATKANAALLQVTDLLDTQDGGNYVFGGQDSANPPVPSPNDILTSGFYTQISAAVGSLSANGASTTIAATLAIASSNATGTSPFTAYMSNPVADIGVQVVATGEGGTVQTGLLASGNSFAVSTGTSTTQSYTRDLMRALATLGSLSSSQVNDTGFAALVRDTGASLNGAVTAMAIDSGILGIAQATLNTTQTQLADTTVALTTQLSPVQNVNMAQTLSELTNTQTQLQSSYRLIAGENSLSLLTYLPAA